MLKKLIYNYWVAIIILPIFDIGVGLHFIELMELPIFWWAIIPIVLFFNLGMAYHVYTFIRKNK